MLKQTTIPRPAEGAVESGSVSTICQLRNENRQLRSRVEELGSRLRKRDEQRRAMIHIMGELNSSNKRLADQRKAMIHILKDYENDRRYLAQQKKRLDDSRVALLHILQDVHQTNLRLGNSRKAMIHIMGDLQEKTEEIQRGETELREKQEQLVQAAKLATLGELTTGVAHELNNPLNNIGLFVGNAIDMIEMRVKDETTVLGELRSTMQQVRKATEIISHLRTFGRAAHVTRSPLDVKAVIVRSLSLMQEQLRIRQINVRMMLGEGEGPTVIGNAIRLEQVFINLVTNARDALADAAEKVIEISSHTDNDYVYLHFQDTGSGIPAEFRERIFDPFFTTKEVGSGTGLGLSITYGIISDHQGTIFLQNGASKGAHFVIQLPLASATCPESRLD